MRHIATILAGAGLAACSTAPSPVTRTAERQAVYEQALAGKVAGAPISCLSNFMPSDMQVIDDTTVLFRQGPGKVVVGQMSGNCGRLLDMGNTLVTKQYGSQGLCRGDISQIVDLSSHMIVGACVVQNLTPYTKA